MNQLLPQKLTQEQKQNLNKLGMTEYKPTTLPKIFNPSCDSYWFLHGGLLIGALLHRVYLRKFVVAPHSLSTTAIFALLYTMYKDRYRYDFLHLLRQWRPIQLEEHLETSPITRNAYKQAIQENENYQQKLKLKIQQLENVEQD